MKSIFEMNSAEEVKSANFPIWEEGSKLAGKPVYIIRENFNEIWGKLTANLVVNLITLRQIAMMGPIANIDLGDIAIIMINSAVSELSGIVLKFFMFHELGHIIYGHGYKQVDGMTQDSGVLFCTTFELEADKYAYEHTGYAIQFKEIARSLHKWTAEKSHEVFRKGDSVENIISDILMDPTIKLRQDNIDKLISLSVAS